VYVPQPGADAESYIRDAATYGVDVKQRDLAFDAAEIVRWRRLGDIQKLG
jgi:hypothetical protein